MWWRSKCHRTLHFILLINVRMMAFFGKELQSKKRCQSNVMVYVYIVFDERSSATRGKPRRNLSEDVW